MSSAPDDTVIRLAKTALPFDEYELSHRLGIETEVNEPSPSVQLRGRSPQ
jgi:hypothetical protein